YQITATPAGNPAFQVSVPIEVYLDPISLFEGPIGLNVGSAVTLRALRPDGSWYPAPLEWQTSGGTGDGGPTDNPYPGSYRFVAGPNTGTFTQTVQVAGSPQVHASTTLTIIDLSSDLKLSTGENVQGHSVLQDQTLATPFQVTTLSGQPYLRPMTWEVATYISYHDQVPNTGTLTFVGVNQVRLSVKSPPGQLYLRACDTEFPRLCTSTYLNVAP
uniref:hypothetical protein n=1 Tax=Deinococcus sp. TaxID=47478 RepID=UPI0025F28438